MARLIQISDIHLLAPPARVGGRIDPVSVLAAAIGRLREALPGLGPVDALLVTGDLSDDGSPESYALLRREIETLGLPLHVIPGNHDRREPMRAAFADLLPADGRLNWTADIADLRLVGLDTLVEGRGGGILDAPTLRFLDAALAQHRGPAMIAMHHPPFAAGIAFMEAIGLDGIRALAEVLGRHDKPMRIVCGHVHAVMVGEVAGVPALSSPGVCSSFGIDFRPDAPIGFFDAPGGFMVHDWAAGFRSIEVGTDAGQGPFPF